MQLKTWAACAAAAASFAFSAGDASAAEGFFRVEKTETGSWRMLDPEGKEFRWLGINHFTPHNGHGATDTYGKFLAIPRKQEPVWRQTNAKRLKEWGFSVLSLARWEVNAMPQLVGAGGLAATITLDVGQIAATEKNDKRYITPFRRTACSAMPNVWHSEFEKIVDKTVEPICRRFRDNKSLIGYFIDNELAWWGYTEKATGLFDNIRKKPFSHSARQAQFAYLKKHAGGSIEKFNEFWSTRYDSWDMFMADDRSYLKADTPERIEAKRGFLKELARRYFEVCTAAIRRHDPNHLVLGCRFAGFAGADKVVWEAAGEYCDVISMNCYPTYDGSVPQLLNQHVNDQTKRTRDNAEPLMPLIMEHSAAAGKPVIISEWSYVADDVGLKNSRGAGCRLANQEERAKAVEFTLKQFYGSGRIVGADWFRWVDCPSGGVRAECPEDSNYGLVNERDEPYPLLIQAFRNALQAEAKP